MKDKIKYVITNSISRDIKEFKHHFNEYISYCSSNTIKIKDGTIYIFHTNNNLTGLRDYISYIEIYIYFLKIQNKQLKDKLNKIEEITNSIDILDIIKED